MPEPIPIDLEIETQPEFEFENAETERGEAVDLDQAEAAEKNITEAELELAQKAGDQLEYKGEDRYRITLDKNNRVTELQNVTTGKIIEGKKPDGTGPDLQIFAESILGRRYSTEVNNGGASFIAVTTQEAGENGEKIFEYVNRWYDVKEAPAVPEEVIDEPEEDRIDAGEFSTLDQTSPQKQEVQHAELWRWLHELSQVSEMRNNEPLQVASYEGLMAEPGAIPTPDIEYSVSEVVVPATATEHSIPESTDARPEAALPLLQTRTLPTPGVEYQVLEAASTELPPSPLDKGGHEGVVGERPKAEKEATVPETELQMRTLATPGVENQMLETSANIVMPTPDVEHPMLKYAAPEAVSEKLPTSPLDKGEHEGVVKEFVTAESPPLAEITQMPVRAVHTMSAPQLERTLVQLVPSEHVETVREAIAAVQEGKMDAVYLPGAHTPEGRLLDVTTLQMVEGHIVYEFRELPENQAENLLEKPEVKLVEQLPAQPIELSHGPEQTQETKTRPEAPATKSETQEKVSAPVLEISFDVELPSPGAVKEGESTQREEVAPEIAAVRPEAAPEPADTSSTIEQAPLRITLQQSANDLPEEVSSPQPPDRSPRQTQAGAARLVA
jgi:hypothetical protein